MRFAHLADTHIRNLKYHKEYKIVFSRIYDKLRELNVDCIIHCGDIAHTKTQISPEFVDMCTSFFKNLADIAPTYVILGNHDGNLRNSSRQDALSPIASALNHPNLHLLKDSGEVKLNEEFSVNVLSVFDRDNWSVPSGDSKTNIALYHGAISNSRTDLGWIMDHGEDDLSIFSPFDFGFLGDIHKTNQILDHDGRVRYCGSTVQQNHGETNDKGFLLWDIQDRDNFTCEHVAVENPKPFITLKLTPKGRMPAKAKVPQGARLRLVSENNLPLDVVRKSVDVAKTRFKPESITYLSRSQGERGSVEGVVDSFANIDLRDIGVQEGLISEYLKDYHPEDEMLERVYALNKKYNTIVEKEEEISRNINWSLKKIEWDNLFNFGEGNCLEFENQSGLVGILGKNYSGKSSIIDSLLYTLYNTTSKNNRKNIDIINQNRDNCRGYVEILVGGTLYKIERTSVKYKRKLKGQETIEARTDVEFSKYCYATDAEESLNGNTRAQTDKNIRKVFGTITDFLMTSMSSQLGSLMYISEGSTRRKEILAKFLDLEFFEQKYRLAHEDAADMRGAIKRLAGKEFEGDIKEARTELARNEAEISVQERECEEIQEKIDSLKTDMSETSSLIESIPAEIIDISKVDSSLKDYESSLSSVIEHNFQLRQELTENKGFLEKMVGFIDSFDNESYENKMSMVSENKKKIDQIASLIKENENKQRVQNKKISLLDDVPCGSEYSHCKFIRDAYAAKNSLKGTLVELNTLSDKRKSLISDISALEPEKTQTYLDKYDQVLEKKGKIQTQCSALQLQLQKNETSILKYKNKISDLSIKKEEYENNREAIENLESLIAKRNDLESSISTSQSQLDLCMQHVMDLYKVNGSLEQKILKTEEEQGEYRELQEQFAAFDLFMKSMHANGISYDVIKKRLPTINDEVSKILTNIVDFEVFFENHDKRLEILIKHPGHDARPIEMGSGAEKTISAMAIRLALLNVSTLPKSDVFILDEPGTALDEDNMEGFIRILDMITTQFKTVLLISHLETLKDTVDKQITIEKIDGFAHVNE